jgi:hypothetical protein
MVTSDHRENYKFESSWVQKWKEVNKVYDLE